MSYLNRTDFLAVFSIDKDMKHTIGSHTVDLCSKFHCSGAVIVTEFVIFVTDYRSFFNIGNHTFKRIMLRNKSFALKHACDIRRRNLIR